MILDFLVIKIITRNYKACISFLDCRSTDKNIRTVMLSFVALDFLFMIFYNTTPNRILSDALLSCRVNIYVM